MNQNIESAILNYIGDRKLEPVTLLDELERSGWDRLPLRRALMKIISDKNTPSITLRAA